MGYNNLKKKPFAKFWMNRYGLIRDKIIRGKSTTTFLIRCRNSGIIPNFIQNSTKNISKLFNLNGGTSINNKISRFIEDFQNRVLRQTIKETHLKLKHFQRELDYIKINLEKIFTRTEMLEFLKFEERVGLSLRNKVNIVHKNKFERLRDLRKKNLNIRFNSKWFINKTDLDIPKDVQWILSLGKKYALPVKKEDFPMLKMIADGEDFIQTIEDKEGQEIARNRFTIMINNHLNKIRNNNRDKYILEKVKETQIFLKGNKDILILTADKGNSTVAISRHDYNIRIDNILTDITSYSVLNKDPTSRLQKINNGLVDELFRNEIITTIEKNRLKTTVAVAPRLYGLPKIHKEGFPLRPICSFINSPSYGLSRYITNILGKINEGSMYNIKNSLDFKHRLMGIRPDVNDRLISFDVVSLFPSVPIDLAMTIIEGKWDVIAGFTSMGKNLFLRILKFCIEDNRYFKYDGKFFFQQKGLPMGSPASPIVADIVMEDLLEKCVGSVMIRPKIITKYVDDLFCIISEDAINDLFDKLNGFNDNIKFTMEKECNFKIPYLDTMVIRRGNNIMMDWYQKSTASGRVVNYYSKHNKKIIINTAKNLIDKVLTISDREFHMANKRKIKDILIQNDFPERLVYSLIGQYGRRVVTSTNNNIEPRIYKSLIYVPGFSERLKGSGMFDTQKYRMTFKTYSTNNKLFSRIKDRMSKWEMSNLVYKIPCTGNTSTNCSKVYIGTTKNTLKTRIAGHKSNQKYRHINAEKTALSSHCFKLNHNPDFENASVLRIENNYKRRLLLEMLEINNIPISNRINFKMDTDNLAQNYRYLFSKN